MKTILQLTFLSVLKFIILNIFVMKSILFKIILTINILFIYNCKAQTTDDYINFYNTITPKLKLIVPNKTQFYSQPFSNFYNELQSKNINITMISYDSKMYGENKYYILHLYFCNRNMLGIASDNSFVYPWIVVLFKNEIPIEIKNMVKQYHGEWNSTFAQFFSDMEIESIEFIGVKGYNVKDYSE